MTVRRDDTPEPQRPPDDGRAVSYVDGGLDDEERRAFERELARSPGLRDEVRRARIVRDLVGGLPRVVPTGLPSAAELLERVEVGGSPRVISLLRRLPRHHAPSFVGANFRATVAAAARRAAGDRAERPAEGAPLVPDSRAPRLRTAGASWAAAAALLLVAVILVAQAPTRRPAGSRIAGVTFRFEVARGLPGRAVEAGAERGALLRVPPSPSSEDRRGMGGRK